MITVNDRNSTIRGGEIKVIYERKECPGCHRLYGHLGGCRVQDLHAELDARIAQVGVANVCIAWEESEESARRAFAFFEEGKR